MAYDHNQEEKYVRYFELRIRTISIDFLRASSVDDDSAVLDLGINESQLRFD